MMYASHSGLLRSSGRECRRATWMQSWRQSPGCGSAMCRTWNSTSIADSSTQYGRSSDSGTLTSRRRNCGNRSTREAKKRSTSLKRTRPPGAVEGS